MVPYDSRLYRKLRPLVLERDKGICQMQGPTCTGVAMTVDHIVPVVEGGADSLDNLRAACWACNARAGQALQVERGNVSGRIGPRSRRW
jgi:5-methylcytosine-specific restriction endonuclease McrA